MTYPETNLVSRLCQLLEERDDWSQDGFRNAVKALLNEHFNEIFRKGKFPGLLPSVSKDGRTLVEVII